MDDNSISLLFYRRLGDSVNSINKHKSNLFFGLSAWFSHSVSTDIVEKWKCNGGTIETYDKAQFLFSEDAECSDTLRFYKSQDQLNQLLTVFHPSCIDKCIDEGDTKKVSIGKYILPPTDIQKMISQGHLGKLVKLPWKSYQNPRKAKELLSKEAPGKSQHPKPDILGANGSKPMDWNEKCQMSKDVVNLMASHSDVFPAPQQKPARNSSPSLSRNVSRGNYQEPKRLKNLNDQVEWYQIPMQYRTPCISTAPSRQQNAAARNPNVQSSIKKDVVENREGSLSNAMYSLGRYTNEFKHIETVSPTTKVQHYLTNECRNNSWEASDNLDGEGADATLENPPVRLRCCTMHSPGDVTHDRIKEQKTQLLCTPRNQRQLHSSSTTASRSKNLRYAVGDHNKNTSPSMNACRVEHNTQDVCAVHIDHISKVGGPLLEFIPGCNGFELNYIG